MPNKYTGEGQATKVAREACAKFPDTPSRTLARMLCEKRPKLFPKLETARCAVRNIRGNHGAKNRKLIKDKTSYRANGKAGMVYIPKSVAKPPPIIEVDGPARVGILSDIHIPFHDAAALEAAVAECKRHKCDVLILNGDTLDFHKMSRFQKDPEAREPAEEIRDCVQLMLWLRKQFPKARLIFKQGNHDRRYSSWIWENAPVLWQLQQVHLENVLGWEMAEATGNESVKLESYGWEHASDSTMIMCGKLPVLHGHEARVSSGGVNPARSLYIKTAHSCLIGHLHKTSQHTESNLFFDECATFSTGCLCELHPGYMPWGAKWNHGFAVVDVQGSGEFNVRNHRIADGKVRAS